MLFAVPLRFSKKSRQGLAASGCSPPHSADASWSQSCSYGGARSVSRTRPLNCLLPVVAAISGDFQHTLKAVVPFFPSLYRTFIPLALHFSAVRFLTFTGHKNTFFFLKLTFRRMTDFLRLQFFFNGVISGLSLIPFLFKQNIFFTLLTFNSKFFKNGKG